MNIRYSSNNSGGNWWLSDANWKALEDAGWYVQWGGKWFCFSKFSLQQRPEGIANICASKKDCKGHRRYQSYSDALSGTRYMGALATDAVKDFDVIADALREFEALTGQTVTDEGCNCCGAPHSFEWTDAAGKWHYVSGDECLDLLYNKPPKSLREAADALEAANV